MSSSSSEDESNVEALKEAVAKDFLTDDIYQNTSKEQTTINKTTEKSLRPGCNKEDSYTNLFGVTPEFRKHVAKHLVNILDEKLKNKIQAFENTDSKKKKKPKGGIKLFSDSDNYIKILKNKQESNINEILKQKRKDASEDEEIELKKIKSVSVNPEDILSKKETIHWSNRSKAHIFRYRRKNNELCLDE